MSRPLKTIIIIAVVLIVFLVVAKSAGWIGEEESTKVELSKVERKTITETVIASGKIQPEVEVKISAEVSGEIIELPFQEGAQVKKGDLLVKINPDLFIAAVNRARASINTAKASLASSKAQFIEAEKNFNRNKSLHKDGVISDADFDAIKRAYEVSQLGVESAQYQLQSAEATLQEAKDNLARTTIYAPMDGTISMLNSEVGERVVGTIQMTGTEILRVANLELMEVLVEVNENDIIQVNYGDTALIEVDAYLDKEFKGVVTEIANSAKLAGTTIDQVTNFEVKVRILKDSYAELLQEGGISPFRPGMTASLEILTDRQNGVLSVPIQAVTTRADTSDMPAYARKKLDDADEEGDELFEIVFVKKEGKAELRVVKTGIQNDEDIVILSGLEEGEEIVTGPYSAISRTLKPGTVISEEKSESKKEE
ncbi:efflux RND transporter periplasmic adaptor subunit [Croceimicrobium hydrocarbonivorans]|uniref:Efflux RND transporter periplasmic adaptor subunit n=1 Tax=Croceimicrobium hydrocarbonivorans TaxID=2761580 RepID=A0A7H0VAX5_9FLAO|nr:efflux RND transporter periplasmic adaptor subunit [Croceimicrobium hydrocarbonivorans]QNR22873.1 efflux RND transporter periplasmic adaptor subunit [Croceimicrobium hydrocarbonivorans]